MGERIECSSFADTTYFPARTTMRQAAGAARFDVDFRVLPDGGFEINLGNVVGIETKTPSNKRHSNASLQ
jgi:hypothetical protein